MLKRVDKQQRLDRIAEQVVAAAEEGKLDAAKEIGDRLDGKAAQAITGEGGGPIALGISWLPPSA